MVKLQCFNLLCIYCTTCAIAMMSRLPQLYEQRQLNAHLFQQSNKSEVMEFEQYFALRYTCNLTESVMLLTFILIIISIPSPPHSFIPGLKPFFCKFFPPLSSFSSSGLTPRIPRTVYRYFCAYPFFTF